ncbi:hypothetical protein A3F64_00540 [Candidatus Saccharibacteria bacterium RIFCSPHIGHO2_12_FULL_42_8]|nr:MAG: hypothetical protein A3F64_00540 [Candidatus Saccharibacteria bacterium RIFCSPHIGHO2_12_FULL_42_8]
MEIEYKGGNGLTIKSSLINITIDPKISLIGLKDIKVTDTLEIVTETGLAIDDDQKILIDGPGEYEVSRVSVKGIAAKKYKDESGTKFTIYRLEISGFRVAILGHCTETLDESQLEAVGIVDILVIPVGGNSYTLDAHQSAKLVNQIDPRIVIPAHYADKAIKYDVDQDDLTGFLKELGAQEHEVVEKLKLKNGVVPAVRTVYEIRRS